MSKALSLFAICCTLWVSTPASAQSFSDVAATIAGCALIEEAQARMPVAPLYQRESGNQCVASNPRNSSLLESLSWFTDEACDARVTFVPTPLLAFCAEIADDAVLGTAEDIVPNSWTLTPGNRLDVGALSLEEVPQPYMQRIRYASFETESGTCELEMRVYSPHPAARGLRSMVAFHGGAWRFRGFGFFGLELTVPHLVDAGFVVYAPFYRLLDDVDGSAGCQNATITELRGDAQTALNWVDANAERYGSRGKPVVFGQSAGAHLAASLWLDRREDVSAAVLLYPPTDFTDFTARVQSGDYTNEQGIDLLQLILGTTADNADVMASPIVENSYPQQVVEQPDGLAPMRMLHGEADTLVESRQSIRLCNAMAGRDIDADLADADVMNAVDGISTTVSCAPNGSVLESDSDSTVASALHLFDEGMHAMDICIDGDFLPDDVCPAGSGTSADAIGQAILESAVFAQAAFDLANPGFGALADNVDEDGVGPESSDAIGTDGTPSTETESDSGSSSSSGFFGSMSPILLALMGVWLIVVGRSRSGFTRLL